MAFSLQICIYSSQDLLHFLDLKKHVSYSYRKIEDYLCEFLTFSCCISISHFSPMFLLFLLRVFFIPMKSCLIQKSWLWV